MSKPLPLSAARVELMRRMAICKRAGKFIGAAERTGMRWQVKFKIFCDALSASPESRVFRSVAALAQGQITHPFVRPLKAPILPPRPAHATRRPRAAARKAASRNAGTEPQGPAWRKPRGWARGPPCAMRARRQSPCGRGGRLVSSQNYFVALSRDVFRHVMPNAAELRMLCQVPDLAICVGQFQKLANNPTKENERQNGVHVP